MQSRECPTYKMLSRLRGANRKPHQHPPSSSHYQHRWRTTFHAIPNSWCNQISCLPKLLSNSVNLTKLCLRPFLFHTNRVWCGAVLCCAVCVCVCECVGSCATIHRVHYPIGNLHIHVLYERHFMQLHNPKISGKATLHGIYAEKRTHKMCITMP